jgi:hypothetical protein
LAPGVLPTAPPATKITPTQLPLYSSSPSYRQVATIIGGLEEQIYNFFTFESVTFYGFFILPSEFSKLKKSAKLRRFRPWGCDTNGPNE